MFFLPLPLNKTLETLDAVRDSSKVALPNPELYVIVNGKPTKGKVVWRNLVNVNQIKTAVQKLTEINWLYNNVDDESVLPVQCWRTPLKRILLVFKLILSET